MSFDAGQDEADITSGCKEMQQLMMHGCGTETRAARRDCLVVEIALIDLLKEIRGLAEEHSKTNATRQLRYLQ